MPSLKLHNSANCPSVELKIDGETHLFLVDTGANRTVLSQKLAKKLHFQRPISVSGFTGRDYAGLYHGKFNALGKTLTQVLVTNIEQIGRELSGILGNDLFGQFKQLEVDYYCMIIRFKE